MKNQISKIVMILAIGFAVVACKDKAKEAVTSEAESASVAENTSVKYAVNAAESKIEWKGFKPTGTHNGAVNIELGTIAVSGDNIQSGTFVIDMNSITEAENNAKLIGHLKSADFFEVEKFPSAAFEITGMEGNMLSGNLTLKGTKNNISFPVTVTNEGDMMTLSSETFTIDRSKWNVKYGSKSFFDDLGDKFINDDMELKISVKASKK